MTLWRLAWLELARRKTATVLLWGTLTLMVAGAGLLFRLGRVAQGRFGRMALAGDALVGGKAGETEMLLGCLNLEGPYPDFIPLRLYQSLINQEKIGFSDQEVNTRFLRLAVPILYCGKYKRYRVIGTTQAFLQQPAPGPAVRLAQGAWDPASAAVVLGAQVARREHLRVGDSLLVFPWTADGPGGISILPYSFRVSGILQSMGNVWDRALFTEVTQGYRMFEHALPDGQTPWGRFVLHYMIVYLQPHGLTALQSLINQRTVAQVTPVAQAYRRLQNLTGTGRAMGAVVLGLLLVLGAVSTAGLLAGRFEAQFRQLALLRALGFQKRDLRNILLYQGLGLGVAACAAGALGDGILFPLVRNLLGSDLPSPQDMPSHLWQSGPVWILALAFTVGASLLPLWRFLRLAPRERLQGLS